MKSPKFSYQVKIIGGALAMMAGGHVCAEASKALAQVEFGSDFFRGGAGTQLDLSRFNKANAMPEGRQRVDIYVNQGWMGRQDVEFRVLNDTQFTVPCFTPAQLDLIGVDLDKLSETARAAVLAAGPQTCLQLSQLVPDATTEVDAGDLRLDISVPQVAMRRSARGYIRPELWDKGVNAATLGYNFNTFSTQTDQSKNTSYFLQLRGGLNLGQWQFRNDSSATRQSDGKTRIQTLNSYAQTSVVDLKSNLLLGDNFTSGQLFDSFSFRGVRLASDPRMLPDSQSGYAPVVRGMARSNAKVQVFQGAALIYETTVAPGRFEINDLYPTGYGGNLRVVVTEADGSQSSFEMPYAAVAQLLRPGTFRYALTAGRTRELANGRPTSNFVQATYEHGLNNELTLFGGSIVATDYLALVGGGAFSTPWGAMSLGVTGSCAQVSANDLRTGQSTKLDFNKNVLETGTNISMAAYRYSTNGYLRLQDLEAIKGLALRGINVAEVERPRSQLQVQISQSLGERGGSFYFSASTQNYWNRNGIGTQYQAGYGSNWGRVSYNVAIQRQREGVTGARSTQYQFSMSVPLGREINSPTASMSASRDSRGGTSMQSVVTGTLGEDRNINYAAAVSRASTGTSQSVNAGYNAPYANFNGSYSQGGGSRQMSATASGAVVVHANGIHFAQSLGDTIGIVQADGAGGATINTNGVRVNDAGYAVVPYLTPFRNNEVIIDPKGTSTDVELVSTSQRVAPYAGSVVLLKYATVTGRSMLVTTRLAGGEPIPFGADVVDEQGGVLGMVGQGGVIFLRTDKDSGRLTVRWGADRNAQCVIQYALGPREKSGEKLAFDQVNADCVTPAELARKKSAQEVVGRAPGQ